MAALPGPKMAAEAVDAVIIARPRARGWRWPAGGMASSTSGRLCAPAMRRPCAPGEQRFETMPREAGDERDLSVQPFGHGRASASRSCLGLARDREMVDIAGEAVIGELRLRCCVPTGACSAVDGDAGGSDADASFRACAWRRWRLLPGVSTPQKLDGDCDWRPHALPWRQPVHHAHD